MKGVPKVDILNQLVSEEYDEIELGYNIDDNIDTVTYRLESVSVAVLNLTYTGDNLTNVSKA